MRGAFNHNFDPYWSGAIYGAYAQLKYGNNSVALICGALAIAQPLITTCDPNFNIAQAGAILRWTPVKNLTFSGDFTWVHLDQKFAGLVALPTVVAIAKPAALYELKDQDTFVFLARAQRNF
jgi:hypothetical protein